MANYTYPGVYIQEVPKGPGPVQSASASTCAMVGFTEEGPTNEPVLITSFPEFTSTFGSFTSKGRLPTSAFAYFQNGGQNLVVVRTVGGSALASSAIIDETVQVQSETVTPPPNGAVTNFTFNLQNTPVIPQSITFEFDNVDYTSNAQGQILDPTSAVKGSIDVQAGLVTLNVDNAPGQLTNILNLTYQYANFTFLAKNEGDWGNDLRVVIEGDENSVVANNYVFYNVFVQRQDEDGNFVDVEVFNGIQFDDSSSSFIENVLNDTRRGSDLVRVVASSNPVVPASIRDRNTTSTVSPQQALDGTSKALTYPIGDTIISDSLTGSILIGDSVELTINALTASNATTGYTFPAIRDVANSSNLRATITSSTSHVCVLNIQQSAIVGTQISTDFTCDNGNDEIVGSLVVNPATGTWSVVNSGVGTNNPVISTIKFEFVRSNPLVFKDDGTGEIVLDSADADVSLHQNGNVNNSNKINYETGLLSIHPVLAVNNQLQAVRGLISFGVANGDAVLSYVVENIVSQVSVSLAGGSDGTGLSRANISSPVLAGSEQGLYALNKTDILLNVCIPDFASSTIISQDLVDYCETRKDRFAILSVPEGYSYTEAIDYKRNTLLRNSNRASIYYPHIKIIDPVSEKEINFPVVAHMAGIFARTDSNRNVSKAPAGTVDGRLAFASGVEVDLTPQQAGFVNTANINNVVSWPYTGLVAWGARTLEPNGDFPYIQMRRLFMFVEKSVFNSTQGFVFESNTAGLRASIKLQIEAFLLSLHRSGHFAGNSPSQSFFVICDSSNNPQTAIDQGQLVVDVGIAPTKPAEFVIFRFQQKTVD